MDFNHHVKIVIDGNPLEFDLIQDVSSEYRIIHTKNAYTKPLFRNSWGISSKILPSEGAGSIAMISTPKEDPLVVSRGV